MSFPTVLLSFFLLDAIFWGTKVAFPHWWVERKARRILASGEFHYLLSGWGRMLFFLLARLFSASYVYFSLLWISFAGLGILLLPFIIISTTFTYYSDQQKFESFENGNVPDEWRVKEREKLRQDIIFSFLFKGFFLFSWLKTFPLFSLHLSVTQKRTISIVAGIVIVVYIVWIVLRGLKRAADQQQRPSPIFRTRQTQKSSIMTEIIPKAYDFHGKRVTEPMEKQYLVFRPTKPMERFVSAPLRKHFEDIEALCRFLETCKYVSDVEQFKQSDYWMPPELFERRKKGDCEDFSLYVWRQLMDMGYSTRFVVGWHFMTGHAWVTLEHDGKQYIVEPLASPITRLRLMTIGYKPEISVERNGKTFQYYAHTITFYVPSLRETTSLVREFRDGLKALPEKKEGDLRDSWLENAFLYAFGLFMLLVELIRREAPLRRLLRLFKLLLIIPLILISLIRFFLSGLFRVIGMPLILISPIWFYLSGLFRFIATLSRKIWRRIFSKSKSPSPLSKKRKRKGRKKEREKERRKEERKRKRRKRKR